MSTKTKIKSRVLCTLLAVLMLLSAFPATVFAAPASDIPKEMLNNPYLDALAYTGYKVQAQKDDGSIFKTYGSRASAYLSGISYGLVKAGTETIADSGTKTGVRRISPVSEAAAFAALPMSPMFITTIFRTSRGSIREAYRSRTIPVPQVHITVRQTHGYLPAKPAGSALHRMRMETISCRTRRSPSVL